MRTRIASIATVTALAAMLAACGTVDPYGPNNYPVSSTSTTTTTYPAGSYAPAGSYTTNVVPGTVVTNNMVEFGRVSNIELIHTTTMGAAPTNSPNANAGTIIGGIAGAVLGSTIGGGSGRAAATVLGAVGGAVVGNRLARNQDGSYASATGQVYRISVQTDGGQWRSYDVAATGDLRVGDRVRIDNNILYRS